MSASVEQNEILRRRSFAIIAHPDAGKTTLTEKLLLYGGAIQLAGHVRAKKDRKSTRSDWMSLEQQRGISVSTAAMQFEYEAHVLNLLDTPGHQDFSEDTYRTLMAVDCAIMVLDGARGVEPQTEKLFQICSERNIPIISFVNKMDLPAQDPLATIDNIESVLSISAAPMVWPLGSGKQFQGVYDLYGDKLHLFESGSGGKQPAAETLTGINDSKLKSLLENENLEALQEGAEIVKSALPEFNKEEFLKGRQTPVFFGSAVSNFGIKLLLENFIQLAPAPSPITLRSGETIDPEEKTFTGFVFKLQANMDKMHRDRVAFIRITSGVFERGMNVNVSRLQKSVKLSSPVAFFGRERNTIDEAYPGDIIGLINPRLYQIGDVLSSGKMPDYQPLPRFAPELFASIACTDTAKIKAFRKGLLELAEEGVVQVFNTLETSPVIGAVGQLQFEVFQFRLEDEYGAPSRISPMSYECSRWFKEEDRAKMGRYERVVEDDSGNPVVLFETKYRLQNFIEQNKDVHLSIHPPPF